MFDPALWLGSAQGPSTLLSSPLQLSPRALGLCCSPLSRRRDKRHTLQESWVRTTLLISTENPWRGCCLTFFPPSFDPWTAW